MTGVQTCALPIYILSDGVDENAKTIIDEQEKEHEIEIVDLTQKVISYDELVDKIEQCDKVISW